MPTTLTGLGALLAAVLGAAMPAVAAGPIVTAPGALVARVGSPTTIAGASVSGFGAGPVRLVISVSSGVLELPVTTADVAIPAGYPPLGTTGPQLAIEGEEAAVNLALADLSWLPVVQGPADITLDVAPAGAAYEPEGAHFYELVTASTPISWDAARDAAASMTFEGLAGSLAQVTTEAEQALLARIAPVDAWIGAAPVAAPAGARWLAAPDPSASVTSYIVEYADPSTDPSLDPSTTDPSAEGGPIVGRASTLLRAAVPPSAPQIGNVSAGVGEATVEWQPPLADSGAPVLGYVVSGDPGGWCAVPATQTSCVLRGLVGGAAHSFRVAAINEVGLGAWSDPSVPVVPTAPVAPAPSSTTVPPAASVDPVNTTVQPFPSEVQIIPPVEETAAPADSGGGDVDQPSAGDDAGAAPMAPAPQPAATRSGPATAATTAPSAATSTDTAAAGRAAAVASTPTPAGPDAELAAGEAAATTDEAVSLVGTPTLTVVFAVGPGASLADARFTVRGKSLSPGTVVTVVAHSEPVVIGTAEVGADGTLEWMGTLPAELADGDHSLIADGVGYDGSKVERTMAFTAESGRLVRIGASSVETIAPTVSASAPAAAPVADAATAADSSDASASSGSSGGSRPRRALMVVVLLGGVAFLWWRSRSRRTVGQRAATTGQPSAGDAVMAPSAAAPASSSRTRGASRRRGMAPAGARRRSRRHAAHSL